MIGAVASAAGPDALALARWQFGITTVYHFFFVPLTIGLSLFVAIMQTRYHRTGDQRFWRLTLLFGNLLIINFAMGVVTGIVQEFQFGMNWSDYSRFVGDIFGAPLALEALLAFFLEATFLGLWVFGRDKLRPGLHLACIWVVAIASLLSAYFILALNSFMQHPVGYRLNEVTGRVELTDFVAILTNPALAGAYPHVITSAWLTAAALVLAVCIWHLYRAGLERARAGDDTAPEQPASGHYTRSAVSAYRAGAKFAATLAIVSGLLSIISGDVQGKVMTEQQPMKMAIAEGLYESTTGPAGLSVLTIGSLDGREEIYSLRIPGLLSYLATGSFDEPVEGIDDIRVQQEALYSSTPESVTFSSTGYAPNVPVTYWSFRFMILAGLLVCGAAVFVRSFLKIEPQPRMGRGWVTVAVALPLLPLLANSAGWIFTEMGRQPWVVFGLMTTEHAVSPGVGVGEVATSLVVLTLLYGALMVIEVRLLLKAIAGGLPPAHAATGLAAPGASEHGAPHPFHTY